MEVFRRLKKTTLLLSCWMALSPLASLAEDIDIFVGASAGTAQNPNVLIVLDNTSNWARQSQQWPGGVQQGQSEVRAIKTAITGLDATINVGMMEFVTGGNANDNGGFIRYAINPMSTTNQGTFGAILDTIFGNVTGTNEKRNSNTPYGNLMYDVYNYFAGANSYSPGGVVSSIADNTGYTSPYTTFKSPLSSTNNCAHNFIIFIGNPNSSGPASDSATNTTALSNLGGDTSELKLPNFTTQTTAVTTPLGNTSQCYSSASTCTSAGVSAFAPSLSTVCSDTTAYPNGCSCGSTVAGTPNCAAGTQRYSVIGTKKAGTAITSQTSVSCYSNAIASATTTAPSGWPSNKETLTSCPAGQSLWFASSTKITANGSCKNNYTYGLECRLNADTTTNLGYTSSCYADTSTCSTSDYTSACSSYTGGCACNSPSTTIGTSCGGGTNLFSVLGNSFTTTVTPTTTTYTDTQQLNADEWSRFLFSNGIPVTDSTTHTTTNQSVVTYTIDVFNAQQNAAQTSLLMGMASAGGGKYYAAKNEDSIVTALKQILAEIQSVNSTFASASLPVSATNRTQNANQVFIGMFRPDPDANPRWYGNMKQYQIGNTPTGLDLVDANGTAATNLQTGFLADCAVSFWSSDSPMPTAWNRDYYWHGIVDNPVPSGKCTTKIGSTLFNKWSDKPDGSFVEKGAVAEVLRKGNHPPYADADSSTPTWQVNRTLYTLSSGSLASVNGTSLASLSANALNFTMGKDVNNDTGQGGPSTSITRPSIHGDVIHSRPLPINYGTTANPNAGVTVYYGSNDGTLRAVDSSNGKEQWAFIAPEFASAAASRSPSSSTDPLTRLMNNSPMVNYPNVSASLNPLPKDYFFDGSIGVYQNVDNSNVWIYPTLRRGGRMVYAFNVTDKTTPTFKWRQGCPNLTNDTGCTTGFSAIGQSWSTPNAAFVKGYSTTTPVIFMGGGYDACEDANTASPTCTSPKGAVVYAIDADSGTRLAALTTERSVASDISLVDMDGDGYVDYAYAADTGGALYRIDLTQRTIDTTGKVVYSALDNNHWAIHKVAYTTGSGRKFLYAPAVFANAGKVYVGIGSGDREHPLTTQYPYTDVVNRFYLYLDDPAAVLANNLDTALVNYTDQGVVNTLIANNNNSCTATGAFSGGSKGWYINLNQNGQGEQTVTSALIAGGMVTFSTNRPIPQTAGTCASVLGEARGYWLNILNAAGAISGSCYINGTYVQNDARCACGGSRSATFAGGGLPPSPVLGVVPIDGKPTTVIIGAIQRDSSTNSPIKPQPVKPTISSARKSVYRYTTGVDSK